MEEQVGGLYAQNASLSRRIDRLDERLERVERRLEFVE
jgi:tetrahydromethanopterin S-methyltransferase subunit G